MKACLDVHYFTNTTCAVAVIFNEWADTKPLNQYTVLVQGNEPYEPGKFYLRELNSNRLLYVTSIGLSQKEAASHILPMSGKFRIPTLLKAVDQSARKDDERGQ